MTFLYVVYVEKLLEKLFVIVMFTLTIANHFFVVAKGVFVYGPTDDKKLWIMWRTIPFMM